MKNDPNALAAHALDAYGDVLFRIALNQLYDRSAAQDAVQDTLVRLLSKRPSFIDETHLKRWLIRVLVNVCHDEQRNAWSTKIDPIDSRYPTSTSASAEEDAISKMEESPVWTALKRLPSNQRIVFHLRFVEQLSERETAEVLGISVIAVRTRIHRARKKLEKYLVEEETGTICNRKQAVADARHPIATMKEGRS